MKPIISDLLLCHHRFLMFPGVSEPQSHFDVMSKDRDILCMLLNDLRLPRSSEALTNEC